MATKLDAAPRLASSAAVGIEVRALGCQATLSALAFFLTYALIHTAHALGHDAPGLARLCSVPLFSCCMSSCAMALVTALFAGRLLRAQPRLVGHLPRLLGVCVLLFTALVVLIP